MPSIETSSTSSSASTSSDAASAEAAGDSRTCSGMSALLNVHRTSAYSARSDKYRGLTLTSAGRPPAARPTTGEWPGRTDLTLYLYLDAALRGLAAGLVEASGAGNHGSFGKISSSFYPERALVRLQAPLDSPGLNEDAEDDPAGERA